MLNFTKPLPLSLYIHIPWCVKKCPYCDFNSHAAPQSLPEQLYISALLQELESHLPLIQQRPITSIFFGGGTPSLFSAVAIEQILKGVEKLTPFASDIEITLEANPGTIDESHFHGFRTAGINRLSIGIQSLQNDKLKTLGRIHDADNALRAVKIAKESGFDNFNIDIMYGLPQQSLADALYDMNTALCLEPTHFSWYQLTLEPNTLFHHQKPTLPSDELIWEMQMAGQSRLAEAGFQQYEVSAYATPNKQCRHNLNYWQFGDYLGIGAGAHSKMTNLQTNEVLRFAQVKNPRDYLIAEKRLTWQPQVVAKDALAFEFMLNALRLTDGVEATLFAERTGLSLNEIDAISKQAIRKGLLMDDATRICPTALGKKFLDNLTALFLV